LCLFFSFERVDILCCGAPAYTLGPDAWSLQQATRSNWAFSESLPMHGLLEQALVGCPMADRPYGPTEGRQGTNHVQ